MDDDLDTPAKHRVTLLVSGERLDLGVLAHTLDLNPTSVTQEGQWRPDGRGTFPISTWSFSVEKRSDSSDEVLQTLLDRVEPVELRLRDFCKISGAKAEVICTITIEQERPAVEFSAETLGRLARAGWPLSIEVIDYS